MRVFVLGATGALGSHLIPLLVSGGHHVTGVTRSADRLAHLNQLGAQGVVLDALDRKQVIAAVCEAQPEVVIHQLTAIPPRLDLRQIDRDFVLTNRLRTEGTDNVLAAAEAAGTEQVIAQSFCGWPYARQGGPVKTEDDPLDTDPPTRMRAILKAIQHLEHSVLQWKGGLVLRYGAFYGPRTSLGSGGASLEDVRSRRFPLVGDGRGVWSFLHVADAAAATVRAMEAHAHGLYNVVDDDPAPVADWLPYLAAVIGAKPPRRVPSWLARILIGPHAVVMMNEIRGASNAKIRRELSWQPAYASWRQGFRTGLG